MLYLELLVGPDRKKMSNPNDATIEKALMTLTPSENSWLTLAWGITEYIIASGCKEEGFIIELERVSRDFHNRIMGNPIDYRTTIQILKLYAQKDLDWAEKYNWERVKLNDIDYRKAPDTIQGKYF